MYSILHIVDITLMIDEDDDDDDDKLTQYNNTAMQCPTLSVNQSLCLSMSQSESINESVCHLASQ